MSRPRIAVIGAGNWGRNHVRTVAANPRAHLAIVCDSDPERCTAVRRQYPAVRVTEDFRDALDGADGVILATPAATHATMATAVLDAGLPVLVEKPMALNVEDAVALASRSESLGVPVLAGHLLLFHPAVERLRGMIERGELGTLYYLYSQRVNLGQVRPDENALWSFGPHDISVAMYLLGSSPQWVAAHGSSYLQPGVEDVVFLTMEFGSGVMVHVQMSWLDPHKERRLTVVGARKMVVFDDMQVREKLKVYDKGVDRPPEYGSYGESLSVREGDIWIPRVSNMEPLRAEVDHFVSVVTGEAVPRANAHDGLEVVRVLSAATESLARKGEAIDLPPTFPPSGVVKA
jgi:predicted dehydrogenase